MNLQHNILIIGLGSMGKRRIRNLKTLGFTKLTGFDLKAERRREAETLYGIKTIDGEELKTMKEPDVFIISVPPAHHHQYMELAADKNIPFFVEASVVDTGMAGIAKKVSAKKLIAAPSGTLYFHPAVRKIYEVVRSGSLGQITNVLYHSGQYLPDWHTYEAVAEYYVSQKETGGAREIVPFELTWLTKLFGFPKRVSGMVKKTIDIAGAETIDDTYNALMDYENFILNLTVDVVSRYPTRKLLINGSEKQLSWSWDKNNIRIFDPEKNDWITESFDTAPAAEGYNSNITEQMYIDELINFFEAVDGGGSFFNTLDYDIRVLQTLYAIERSSAEMKSIELQ